MGMGDKGDNGKDERYDTGSDEVPPESRDCRIVRDNEKGGTVFKLWSQMEGSHLPQKRHCRRLEQLEPTQAHNGDTHLDCGVVAVASRGIRRAAVSSWNDRDLSWRDRLHDQDLARVGSTVSQGKLHHISKSAEG
ncbi:hypothetical protein G5714_014432 [Onychostoma macrolepis]|uniref:Uncharacterized protein n=1 Tax=Onychostoma macrolepis TaxID=369639 RepID=A0A7J6CDD2_9TELE|nr:hypothetical protein G5714_014432 [Onychostoma macrolepis]